jgi:hypothetical protein
MTNEQREFLQSGPRIHPATESGIIRLGGVATLTVLWRRHRAELMAAAPAGTRPYGFWKLERRFKHAPRDLTAQARLIRTLNLYANDAEKAIVHRRLDAVVQARRAVCEALRSVA